MNGLHQGRSGAFDLGNHYLLPRFDQNVAVVCDLKVVVGLQHLPYHVGRGVRLVVLLAEHTLDRCTIQAVPEPAKFESTSSTRVVLAAFVAAAQVGSFVHIATY